ncbi:tRNA pseudouridine(55) synthase TruB [Stakelama sediminis]|uniref:tRNA pseudouridine synthase B n=1 Tax=Stakelama sediminis TaxID=463200 RepID=A0A840YWM9_9SPHN|nr:tRNA pseudouridine(55) synthase TruB [Stakelama sediminis]MBB5717957.1 tRNA pseudouridine55 synthase [Stakelama sediminis]
MHGWIILDKPVGLGSTQAVSAVKRALRDGGYPKRKVGHGGTLDPLASGVLPVAVGEATKLAGRMLDSDKVYEFTIRFGEQTDTLDTEGQVIATSDSRPTFDAVEKVLSQFTGAVDQMPPAFSALKVDGKRAYDLARKGEAVELAPRRVTVHSLHSSPARGGEQPRSGGGGGLPLGDTPDEPPLHQPAAGPPPRTGEELETATLVAHVSKGTYIRSLARDIALALGTVGHVTMLRRIKAGPFDLQSAISLDKLAEMAKARALEDISLPLTAGLDDIPALPVTPDQAGLLRQGRVLIGIAADDGPAFAMLDDVPVALVRVEDRQVRVERGFNL